MLLAQGIAVLAQAIQFFLVGRALGATGFGAYAGVMALVFVLAPFATWGSGMILIMRVSRNRTLFSLYWGNALLTVLVAGGGLLVVCVVLSRFVLPHVTLTLVVGLALGELIFGRVLDVAGQAFQAFEQLKGTAAVATALNVSRAVAAALWVILPLPHSPSVWAVVYLVATAVPAVGAYMVISRRLGRPAPAPRAALGDLRLGGYFAVSLQASNIYNDIDKVMLARLGSLYATGIYTAAYRVITMAFMPMSALIYSLYARFFQEGLTGIRGSTRLAIRMIPLSSVYGLAAFVGLIVFAPLFPRILGAQYNGSVDAIRLLALLPLLKGLHYFAADALTGAGRQGVRTAVQAVVAAINIGANWLLIPLYSWRGAAWASLLSDGLLAVLLWSVLWRLHVPETRVVGQAIP
jgi:O-antigen/teichoic acid export membrane protein